MDGGSLRKVLDLERRRGYDNSAVIGGLDRFLRKWAGANTGSVTSRTQLARFRRLFNITYADMPQEERQAWVGGVLQFLDEMEGPGNLGQSPAAEVNALPVTTAPAVRKKTAPPAGGSLDAPVTAVKGISQGLAEKFGRLGVRTVRDLLYFFPRRHIDYSRLNFISQLAIDEEQTIVANVWQAYESRPGGRASTEAIVGDETGNIRVIWFNQPYLVKRLVTNSRIVISGRVSLFRGQPVFQSPEWEVLEGQDLVHTGRLVPVYPLTRGLYPRQVRRLMKEFIDNWAGCLTDYLSPELRERLEMLELPEAIRQAHFPDDAADKDRARRRLAFDELFLLQLGVLHHKRKWQEDRPAIPCDVETPVLKRFLASLPFTLTGAQRRVFQEILADMALTRPMCRLLQGEVGSGKTVVATAALLVAAASGQQGAFMAPTEILAEQHFQTICQILGNIGQAEDRGNIRCFHGLMERPLNLALLIGDLRQAEKQELRRMIAAGEIDIAIGTHALVQKGVGFSRLGLVVVDEQHRFGVEQRAALRGKGNNPHMLVMTATPIPRTLALTLYGDLDLSVIDEMPPGRMPVRTKWLRPEQLHSAYNFIRRQVGEGRQAFILCPLIEESEAVAAQAATAEYERLSREVFPELRLGLLHGRMAAREKDSVMADFRAGNLDILVSTPVIEVGIDIPNATVMLIESAERFGLSQLHQLRGRVGRGKDQGYCLLAAENPSEVGRQRLDIIESVQDGFRLAEEDLKMRGPGEFFGTRQSGLPDLRMARLSDLAILELARREAMHLFQTDPGLEKKEHRPLAAELARVWANVGEWS